jgi:hypothetical protein
VLKALLRELPARLAPTDAAALGASAAAAQADALGSGTGGEMAAEYARSKLQERLRLMHGLQVRFGAKARASYCCFDCRPGGLQEQQGYAECRSTATAASGGLGSFSFSIAHVSRTGPCPLRSRPRPQKVAHNERVEREMRGCLVNGHVTALPFSDAWAAAVSDAVLNSGVHRTVDPRVKFAMAAHVEPLGAAFVCRIWIYVAAVRDAA